MTPEPNNHHFEQARKLWALEGDISFIRRVENFVYETQLNGNPVILRLTEPRHRKVQELSSELDWMDYLSSSGMQIAAPISSINDVLVETLNGEETYFACLFKKAPGRSLVEKEDFTLEIMETWGRYVGKLHGLTKGYRPIQGIQNRSLWSEDAAFQVNLKGLDKDDSVPYSRFQDLMEWLSDLNTDRESFGLVHADLHHGNFFVDNSSITAFDFDDCQFHWFAFDLAVPLYALTRMNGEDYFDLSFDKMKDSYFSGYAQENALDQIWFDRVDLFLQLRIATVYHWAQANIKDGIFNQRQIDWAKKVLPWSHAQMANNIKLI